MSRGGLVARSRCGVDVERTSSRRDYLAGRRAPPGRFRVEEASVKNEKVALPASPSAPLPPIATAVAFAVCVK